ncbi:MAG: hypothetical protein ABI216_06915 [Devosia sp.]
MKLFPRDKKSVQLDLHRLYLWSCLAGAFFCVSFALFHQYQFTFHSDAAIKTVLARLSVHDGRLLPSNWVFANGDLFLASPYIFSIIIYPWLGISYLANAMASWLAYLYLSFAVYGTCRLVAPTQPRAALAAAALTAGGLSAANFEFTIAQGGYSIIVALALCVSALASTRLTTTGGKKYVTLSLAFVAAVMVCAGNSVRGNVTVMIPVLSGWLVSMLATSAPNIRERIRRLYNPTIFSIILGLIIGNTIYKLWLLPNALNYEAAARIAIATKSEMWGHFLNLPQAWFGYFRIWGPWESLTSSLRLLQCLTWLIAFASVFAPIWVISTPRYHEQPIVTLSWIVLAGYGVCFSALIVSSVLFTGSAEIRYATFPIYGSIILISVLVDRLAKTHQRDGKVLFLVLGLVSVLTSSMWHMESNLSIADPSGINYTQRMSLIRSLETNGVGTVLTTYWNSHVLTVLSNGEIDGYPVGLDPLYPFAHHMPRHIFYGSAGTRQAVAFTSSEADPQVWTAIKYQLGDPIRKLVDGPFNIWVYDRDIAQAVLETGHEVDAAIPKDQLEVLLSKSDFAACISDTPCQTWITVTNTGTHALASVGSLPLRLGIHGVDSNGSIIIQDEGRADFPGIIESGAAARVRLVLPPMSDPRATSYQVCLLQEGVAWLCDHTHAH